MSIIDDYGEIPKYKKRSKKRPPKKSDHAHDYEEIIAKVVKDGDVNIYPVQMCKTCGKTQRRKIFFTSEVIENNTKYHKVLFNEEEIKKEHPELRVVEFNYEIW